MGRQNSALFKNLRNRSAGPLWALLRETVQKIPADRRNLIPSSKLLSEPYFSSLNKAVDEIAKEKHDKVASIDFNIVLRPLCNVIVDSLRGKIFGYFEETRQRPFSNSFDGIFRSLTGPGEPFVGLWNYSGPHSFAKNQVFLVDIVNKTAMDMTPLYVWGLNAIAGDGRPSDLYVYDSSKGDSHIFNAVQERIETTVSQEGALDALWTMVGACKLSDPPLILFSGVVLTKRKT